MKRRPRNKYTAEQISTISDCYNKGESLHTIARMFDRFHGSVSGIFGRSGGIRRPERKRRDSSLTIEEREDIPRGIVAGLSIRSIAQSLDRAPSTVQRGIVFSIHIIGSDSGCYLLHDVFQRLDKFLQLRRGHLFGIENNIDTSQIKS